MDILRSADETDRCQAIAFFIVSAFCGIDESLVIAEAKVVVGTHVEQLFAVLHDDVGSLRGSEWCFGFEQAGIFDIFNGLCVIS